MRKTTGLAAVVIFGFAVGAAHGITIPISNGDFENPIVGGNFATINGPDNTVGLPGWTVNGSIDHIGNYWQANTGTESLDMAGNFAGSISQNVFIPGTGSATVHFAMAGNPDERGVKTLQVELIGDGGPQVFYFDSTGHTYSAMGWQTFNATFSIAAAGTYTLVFSDAGVPTDPWGPALDSVSMTAQVPDGGLTVMLLGMGLAGVGTLRRKLS